MRAMVPKAAQKLLDLGFEAGLIPKRITGGVRPLKRRNGSEPRL